MFSKKASKYGFYSIKDCFERVKKNILESRTSTFNYVYINGLDEASHTNGVDSKEVSDIINAVEDGIKNVANEETSVILIADHGQVDMTSMMYLNQKTDYTKLLTNELKDKANEIYGLYSEYSKLIVDAYSTSISKIKLPDGNEVTDSKFISEYLNRVDIKLGNEIKSAIDELNGYGIPQKLDLECECCGHKWEEKFYGYNMSDFLF